MIVLTFMLQNSAWIIPTIGWAISEYLGIRSGAEKASTLQVLADFGKFLGNMGNKDQADKNDKLG
jgi:hypothetical protein